MTEETDSTRDMALAVMRSRGYAWERVGKGQRHVVHLRKDSRVYRALLKVASRGTAMVRTDSDNADTANISGFGSDVDFVLFAVGNPTAPVKTVRAFLVPITEAEEAFRDAHRQYRQSKPNSNPNQTWVIDFSPRNSATNGNYANKWKDYEVGTPYSIGQPLEEDEPAPSLTIAEAKRLLAKSLNVPIESIRILIDA